jgi:hypothetical protein
MDRDDIQSVAEDIVHLRDEWGSDISDAAIRRGSAVLRRLLVENAYGQAWRAAGFLKDPVVVTVDLDATISSEEPSETVVALASGAKLKRMQVAGARLRRTDRAPSSTMSEDAAPRECSWGITAYLASTAGYADGVRVTPRDVIKYIANIALATPPPSATSDRSCARHCAIPPALPASARSADRRRRVC